MKDNLSIVGHREYLINYLKKKFPESRKEDLEDVVQSAIIKAHRYNHLWNEKCSLKTWLTHIAYNIYIDSIRKKYNKFECLISSNEDSYLFDNVLIDDFSHNIIDGDNEDKLLDRLFFDCADNIHIQAFKLSVIDEIDYKEISEKYNIPIGTVKSRVFRGRKILQERYNQYLVGE